MRLSKVCFSVLLISLCYSSAFAQGYGKNKVQYRHFDWSSISSTHFDVYFYEEAESLAYFAVEVAERASSKLSLDLGHTLTKKVPIIVYASHNDFEQTNVITELIEEGVGGFTEIFKNRVVVPFTGSYEDFRHVLVHELTHAYMFDALYGDVLESWLTGQYFFQLPLWFAEGLAEYESLGWDSESDMFMRDATISGYLVPLDMISGGYLAYKEGQSAIRYIVERHGREKLAEMIASARGMRSMDRVFDRAFGMSQSKFSDEWIKYLKKEYWPEVSKREDPEKFARRVTDHERDNSYINADPAISPDGERIAVLSDRRQFTDVYLISAIDGKMLKRLVRGERSSQFESVPLFKRSLAWSADGKKLAVVAKSKGKDVLHLIDGVSGRVKSTLKPPLEGISSPSWSPDGEKIVISGLKDGKADLYLSDTGSGKTRRLTNDVYDDIDAVWTRDGNKIFFASDRGSPVAASQIMNGVEKGFRYSVFSIDVETEDIKEVFSHPGGAVSLALSPDGSKLAFISSGGGTRNVFLYDLDKSTVSQLTNVLGGVFSISWSLENDRMAFSIFTGGGWDVFVAQEVASMTPVSVASSGEPKAEEKKNEEEVSRPRNVVILPLSEKIEKALAEGVQSSLPESTETDTAYVEEPKPYKFKLTADGISGGFQYNSAVGFGGSTELSLSDMFGNHRIYLASDLFSSIDQTDIMFVYYYLAKRLDMGIGAFHYKNYYYSSITLLGEQFSRARFFSERTYGYVLLGSYPFGKFSRLDLDLTHLTIEREFLPDYLVYPVPQDNPKQVIRILSPSISLVKDTSLWGQLGPTNGARWWVAYSPSVRLTENYRSFRKVSFDLRKYVGFSRGYSLAMRVGGSIGGGAQPETLLMGGVYTIRGYGDFEFRGTKATFVNAELRYPFISHLGIVWPIPISIRNIGGIVFFDAGAAWYDNREFKAFTHSQGGHRLDSVKAAFGTGLHTSLSFLILKVDFAWPTDLDHVGKSHIHFSLGAEY
ncbi:MAG: BamA/TamA family outer membrane protein [Candidatus Eisenbacteria bacterium]|nr:BamA/TamA family outer membrane protein [Candidatus Eisenbacteria bacterium]